MMPRKMVSPQAMTAALAALFLTVALAACGDEGGETGGESSEKADYLERANSICTDLTSKSAELADTTFERREGLPPEKSLRAYQRESVDLQRRALADLRALDPPPGDESVVEEIYAAMEQALNELAAIPPSQPGPASVPSVERFRGLASAYGLEDCSGV